MKSNWNEIQQRITDDLKLKIVKCIRKAIEDDYPRNVEMFGLVTTNGAGLQIGNFINTNIQSDIIGTDVEVHDFVRYGWHGRIIADHDSRMVYTVMSHSRLESLSKTFKETPHYARVLAYIFNEGYNAKNKQVSLFGYPYTDSSIKSHAMKIIQGNIPTDDDYIYCIITYVAKNLQLQECKIVFVDKDLDIIEELSLSDYIKPDYAQLTMRGSHEIENEKSKKLVSLKKKNKLIEEKEVSSIEMQQVEQKDTEPITLREDKTSKKADKIS